MAQKDTKKTELLIGAFVVSAVIIISGMILILGGGISLFEDRYAVGISINHIGDLQTGAPVKLGGVEIGKVSKITLEKKNIEITCDINAKYTLTKDCIARIANSGLVGDTFLEFSQGKSKEYLDTTTTTIEEFKTKRGQLGLIHGEGQVSMGELFAQVQGIGNEIVAITRNVNDIIGDDQFKRNIKETVANVNATSMEAKRLLTSLRKSTENIQETSADVRDMAFRLKKMSETIETAVNKTIGDEKNIKQINEAIAHTKDITKNASAILARTDKMLQEKEKEIKATIDNIHDVSKKAKEIAGSIETQKVKGAVDKLLNAVNDASSLVATIRREIAIALVINKGADRIVDAKWEQMNRDRNLRNDPDKMLEEFNRWVKENLRKGLFDDPAHPDPSTRHYDKVGKNKGKW